jgi:hypothetical protein
MSALGYDTWPCAATALRAAQQALSDAEWHGRPASEIAVLADRVASIRREIQGGLDRLPPF